MSAPFFRRSCLALMLSLLTVSAWAQSRPADLQAIPEPPPPPPGLADTTFEPQVTIRKRGEDQVEEFRLGGRLYMVRVTPPHGVPYYLVDPKGDGGFVRQDISEKPLAVPMWVIGTF